MLLGIDPGLFGAFAVYDRETNKVITTGNIPTLEVRRNEKHKNVVNINHLLVIMSRIASSHPNIRAALELVGAMPGQGVSSMFSFGRTDGIIETCVVAAGIPFTKVTPRVWKKALGCPADKDGALLRASQLMPASASEWTPERGLRTKEQCKGIAEAALIAYYGSKFVVDSSLLSA